MLPYVMALTALCAVSMVRAQTLAVYVSPAAESDAFPYLRQEVGRILSPLGFQLEWRDLARRANGESFDNLAVAEFTGPCSSDALIPARGAPESSELATTAVSNGVVLPFARVDCGRVGQMLFPWLAGRKTEVQNITERE